MQKEKFARLEEKLPEEKVKLVYMWIKQGVLSYKEFSYLINTGELTRPPIEE